MLNHQVKGLQDKLLEYWAYIEEIRLPRLGRNMAIFFLRGFRYFMGRSIYKKSAWRWKVMLRGLSFNCIFVVFTSGPLFEWTQMSYTSLSDLLTIGILAILIFPLLSVSIYVTIRVMFIVVGNSAWHKKFLFFLLDIVLSTSLSTILRTLFYAVEQAFLGIMGGEVEQASGWSFVTRGMLKFATYREAIFEMLESLLNFSMDPKYVMINFWIAAPSIICFLLIGLLGLSKSEGSFSPLLFV